MAHCTGNARGCPAGYAFLIIQGAGMFPPGAKRTVHITWSSRTLFVFAGVGAAVGFNNFWQFPSLVFTHGGGAFLIVYFLCAVGLGLPLLAAEFMIGRLGRDAPDGAFHRAAMLVRAERLWWIVGAAAVLSGFLIFAYLSVVAGWTVAFGVRAATGVFSALTAEPY
jgi:neurotransmitter:Na+ symporter, NSS family